MSPNDPDLPTQDLPRMVPDREDIARRRKSVPEDRHASQTASSSPAWLIILVFIIICATGFLFWQNYQLKISLDQNLQDLSLSNARIGVLEGQLSDTGDNLVVNEANIKAQFKNHMSEIRKLWDVTNKRNKVWIQENQVAVKNIQKDMKVSQGKITAAETRSDVLASTQSDIQSTILNLDDAVQRSLADSESAITNIQASIAGINPKLDELSLSQNLLSDQVRSQNISELEQLIQQQAQNLIDLTASIDATQSETSQDLESINSHRLQINQRLTSLQDQLMVLENKLIELSPEL